MPSRLKPNSPTYLKGDHDVHSISHTPDVSLPQVPRHADLWELWGPGIHIVTMWQGTPIRHLADPPHTHPGLATKKIHPSNATLSLSSPGQWCSPAGLCQPIPLPVPQSDIHPFDPESPSQGQHFSGSFTLLHYSQAVETTWPQAEEPQHNLYGNKA